MLATQKIHPAALWAQNNELKPIEIDCATAIMLKILDGKCKMFPEEKHAMTLFYDVSKHKSGIFLGQDIHNLIRQARLGITDELKEKVYEQRLYAETMITRPVMKKFKAKLRTHGIIGNV
ncbi:MAG: hypothetical protein R3240_03190 [Gammaproteobacteria bacterium]|nr:hypothetical protein [Gammaproteobacteria bacterium]